MDMTEALKTARAASESGISQGQSTYKCPLCEDVGYTVKRTEGGSIAYKECVCSIRKRNQRRIERSGLKDLLSKCTLESYQTPEDWQKRVKESAMRFLSAFRWNWFYIGGSSGSGKTHLCTAMCGELMKKDLPVLYVQWRADIPAIKAKVNDAEAYETAIAPLKRIRVLYIDDFLKGSVTDGDRNIAFDLLNARYIDPHCITIISSEWSLDKVLSWDEAIGSRIAERAKGVVNLTGDKNYRLRK